MAMIWPMTLAGSGAIVWVLIARLILRRGPKVFSYALWAVVLLRLLCPVSLQGPVSLVGGSEAAAAGLPMLQTEEAPRPDTRDGRGARR